MAEEHVDLNGTEVEGEVLPGTQAEKIASDAADTQEKTGSESEDAQQKTEPPKTYSQEEVDKLLADAMTAQEDAKDPKEKEYESRVAALNARELELGAKELLSKNGVSEEFLGFLMQGDMETTTKNVEKFKEAYEADLKAKLDAALIGKTPQGGATGSVTKGDKSAAEVFAAALRR